MDDFERQVAEAIHRFQTPQGGIVLPMHIAELLAPRIAAALVAAHEDGLADEMGGSIGLAAASLPVLRG